MLALAMQSAGKEKPNAAGLGWELKASDVPFEREVFSVQEDCLEIGNEQQRYAYIVRPEAVIIVPVTARGEIVMVRQYRYPIDEWCLEVPAGGTHDTGGESLEEVVRDELREEIGGTAKTLTHVGTFYTSPSLTSEKCHVFLAEKVVLEKKPDRETTEKIEIELRPVSQVVSLVRSGEMKTAPCALAVLLCEPLLRQRGYL